MEVHHHSHGNNHSKKKWSHYFWEFFMLFLAVALGFFVEGQREHIVERHRAKDYAKALVRDLKSDTASMNKWMGYYDLFIATMDSMISMSIHKEIRPATSGRFGWYCRHSLWHVPVPWQRTTLDQIKSSGNIRYFKSFRLQEMISKYNIEVENFIRTFILENPSSDKARDLANKVLDVESNYEYSKIQLMELPSLKPGYIDSLVSARIVPLAGKEDIVNELLNMAIYRRRSYRSLQKHLPEMRVMAIDLIRELEKEYHL